MNSFLPTPDWIFREFSKQMRQQMSEEVFWKLAHPITGADTGLKAVPGPALMASEPEAICIMEPTEQRP